MHTRRLSPVSSLLFVTLLFLVAVAAASCGRASASGADPAAGVPSLVAERIAGDSVRLIARWSPACDAKGCADGYATQWIAGPATVRTAVVTATTDTARVALPPIGDSVRVVVGVTTRRRGRTGPTKSASLWLRQDDAQPPAVDSLKLDTARFSALYDSARYAAYSSRGVPVPLTALTVAEHDSLLLVHHLWVKAGAQRRAVDRVGWQQVGDTMGAVLRRPHDRWGDSVWVVARDCQCRESGHATNPPQYDAATGVWRVRSALGGWRAVTPRVGL